MECVCHCTTAYAGESIELSCGSLQHQRRSLTVNMQGYKGEKLVIKPQVILGKWKQFPALKGEKQIIKTRFRFTLQDTQYCK